MSEALLLANMGGPTAPDEVRNYLRAIFRDPAILPVPNALRYLLASLISARRAEKVRARYGLIGGASPLPGWTMAQRDAVESALRADGSEMLVEYAFRYTSPTLAEALAELARQGVAQVTLLPLFPHYTHAMTGSIVKEALKAAAPLAIRLRAINAWGSRAEVLDLWREYLSAALTEAGAGARVLFVAHGIPERNVKRGEDYPCRVMDTALKLAASLPADTAWSVAFQSKVGPVAWTQPYLENELTRFCRTREPLVIMPLSFVADCLETLYDLDIVAAAAAKKAGVRRVVRVGAFNNDPRFARVLARMVHEGSYVA
jgi:ferrochelatase